MVPPETLAEPESLVPVDRGVGAEAALSPDALRAITDAARKVVSKVCSNAPLQTTPLPISVAEFEGLVVAADAPLSMATFHERNGEVENMEESAWDGTSPAPGAKTLTFRKKIPFVGPFKKWATLTMRLTVLDSVAAGGASCIFSIRTNVSGVLYSDCFTVYECWACSPDALPHRSVLRSYLRVEFLKDTPVRSIIESQSKKDLAEATELWKSMAAPLVRDIVRGRRGGRAAAPPPEEAPRTPSKPPSHRKGAARSLCPCCDKSCKLGGECQHCITTYEESVAHPSPAPDARPFYTPCTSIGGCTRCGCAPVCTKCGCRCRLCGQFGSVGACVTVGCAACKCKPQCQTCGCQCGLCGNKGALAACGTLGCAACDCAPRWVPWGRKYTPKRH